MKTFKIGIAGTHSTGKTTFVTLLERTFAQLNVTTKRVRDLASEARDRGFPILREHTYESTLWIMTTGISRELELATAADVVIVDRPVGDALGYLGAALEHRGAVLPDGDREVLETLTRHHSRSYDVLFKTDVDPTIAIDRTKDRDFDPAYRLLCAHHVDRVFSDLAIPHHALGASDHDASVARVVQAYYARRGDRP